MLTALRRATLAALVAAGVAFPGGASAADADALHVMLDGGIAESRLQVVPRLIAAAGSHFNYAVTAKKSGGTGSTSTHQQGAVEVGPGGEAALAGLTLSLLPGERCDVEVSVSQGSAVVAHRVWRFAP